MCLRNGKDNAKINLNVYNVTLGKKKTIAQRACVVVMFVELRKLVQDKTTDSRMTVQGKVTDKGIVLFLELQVPIFVCAFGEVDAKKHRGNQ